MKAILSKLLARASDLVDVQPVLALFLGGAFLAVLLTTILRPRPGSEPDAPSSLLWTLYRQGTRFVWAMALLGFLLAALSLLRVYLHQALAGFQRNHGRITEANYNAIQTIWGTPQQQGELRFDLYYEEEITERIESEDVTKPAVLRKKIVRHDITANPFLVARHEVTLRQNARKKGSALYGGYETACRFTWKLKNPADRDLNSLLKFPLPSATGIYDDLTATLNGQDVLAPDADQGWRPSPGPGRESKRTAGFCHQFQEPRHVVLVLSGPGTTRDPRFHFHTQSARPCQGALELS
jgi:hypothetical protein